MGVHLTVQPEHTEIDKAKMDPSGAGVDADVQDIKEKALGLVPRVSWLGYPLSIPCCCPIRSSLRRDVQLICKFALTSTSTPRLFGHFDNRIYIVVDMPKCPHTRFKHLSLLGAVSRL